MSFRFDNIFILSISVVFYSICIIFYANSLPEDVLSMIFLLPLFAASVMSFTLSQKYKKIKYFRVGYLFLGMSMASYAAAEIMWLTLGYLGMVQYPSVVDVFYVGYFITAILHPLAILKFFDVKLKRSHLVIFGIVVITLLTIYGIFSYEMILEESYYYGILFVTLSSILLGVSVVTILSTRGRRVFKVWVIIGVSFLINAVTDIYYYISENYTDWSPGNWENIAWFVAQILLVYALLEHRKTYSGLQK